MNKQFFNAKILAPLEEYVQFGETKNDMGTRLIGHAPHIAPKAYVNIVYAPLDKNNFIEFNERFGPLVNSQYKEFLNCANGLNVFSDALRVFGYRPLKRKSGSGPHDYPGCIVTPNVSGRIKGLKENDMIVGSYSGDGSYVMLDGSGRVVRFDAKGDGATIQEWTDFNTWLSSEIAILNEDYKAGKVSIFVPSTAK